MFRSFSTGFLWAGCLATLCVPVLADQTAAQTAGVCDLDGSSTGPCKVEIDLAEGVLPRALPFDVPVYLEGKLGAEHASIQRLVLHVFQARQPIRVAEECPGAVRSLGDCLPGERQIVCYLQGAEGSIRPAAARRPISVLDGSAAAEEECTLAAQASVWERPSQASSSEPATFFLRVPPLKANQYFVLYLETEQSLPKPQQDDLEALVKDKVKEQIEAALQGQGGDFNAWAGRLKKGICSAMREVEGRHRVRFQARPDSLFDCGSDAAEPEALDGQLEELFSLLADVREQVRVVEESRRELKADLDALLDDAPTQTMFLAGKGLLGVTEKQLNDPGIRLLPYEEVFAKTAELREQLSAVLQKLPKGQNPPASANRVQESLGYLDAARDRYQLLLSAASALARQAVLVNGSTIGSFITRQRAYLSADFGFLYAEGPEEALPYIGTNIYFAPVNKQAPLTWRDGHPWKRLGVTIGVTIGKFSDDRTQALFSSNNLTVGVGYRVTESIRVGGGIVGFKKKDPDPLVSGTSPATSYYVSASFDWDVNGLIQWFGNIFPNR